MDILITLVVLLLTLWLIWRWQTFLTFQRLGIPGPKPNILFGNLLEICRKGRIKCHEEWTKEYGRVLGYYFGMTPALLVSDPNLLKNIMIKDFSKFMRREIFVPLNDMDPQDPSRESLSGSTGEKWKRLRGIVTPTFTTAKIKQMFRNCNHPINLMMGKLQKFAEDNEEFEAYDVYRILVFKIFARTSLGLNIDEKSNEFSKILSFLEIPEKMYNSDPLTVIGKSFPFLHRLCVKIEGIRNFLLYGATSRSYIYPRTMEIIEMRRQKPLGKNVDLLQLLVNAYSNKSEEEVDNSELEAGNTQNEMKGDEKQIQDSKKCNFMTTEEIKAVGYSLFLGAYGTISRFFSFASYYLAKHQDIQEKLYGEIETYYQKEKIFEYTSLIKLPYLNKVFCEVLRISPISTFFSNRHADEDVVYGDIKIPKNMLVQTPTYLIHHDPEFWNNPEEFDPERFEEKPNSNQITYLPFGIGPRNCIAKRFAEMEIKLILALIIYHFRIHLTKHKEYLPLVEYARSSAPSEGVWIKVEKRHEYQPLPV